MTNIPDKYQPYPLAKNLRYFMKVRKLTVRHLASLAQVSKSVAHNWIYGTSPRNLWAIRRLSKELDVSFEALIFEELDKK